MKEEALLPCPLCRSKAVGVFLQDKGYKITCAGRCLIYCKADSKELCYKAWNTRINPAPIPDEEKLLNKIADALVTCYGETFVLEAYYPEARCVLAAITPYLRHKSETSELREVREAFRLLSSHTAIWNNPCTPADATVDLRVKQALATLDRLLGKEGE